MLSSTVGTIIASVVAVVNHAPTCRGVVKSPTAASDAQPTLGVRRTSRAVCTPRAAAEAAAAGTSESAGAPPSRQALHPDTSDRHQRSARAAQRGVSAHPHRVHVACGTRPPWQVNVQVHRRHPVRL